MRTFVAIEIEPLIKDEIASLIYELSITRERVSWVKRESIHLTLKFLGEIDEKRLKEISERLKKTTSKIKPFRIKLEGAGWFPERSSKPRVLWIGVKYPDELKNLWKEIEREMEQIGFKPEGREFSPHITIGRVKEGGSINKVTEILNKYLKSTFGEMEVRRIILFQSVLKPDGAEYRPIERFEFK